MNIKAKPKTIKCKCPLCDGKGHLVVIIKPKIDSKSLSKVAKKMRDMGFTIRQIASAMGYEHPGSISHLLNKK